MKKYLCVLIAVVMIMFFAACSKNGSDDVVDSTGDIDVLATNDTLANSDSAQDSQNGTSDSVSSPADFIGFDTEKGYYIDEYTGNAKIVMIPEELDGKKVTGIEYDAFANNNNFEEIVFSSGITEIESYTFSVAYSLKKVTLNEGLTKIEDHAFINCENLSEIVIPSTLKAIGNYAFCACSSLKEIQLPEGLNEIGYTVFGNCAFESITFPSTVKFLDQSVVDDCYNLKSVYIMGADTVIDEYAISDSPNAVIYGYSGSTAEAYAQNKGISFVAIN